MFKAKRKNNKGRQVYSYSCFGIQPVSEGSGFKKKNNILSGFIGIK